MCNQVEIDGREVGRGMQHFPTISKIGCRLLGSAIALLHHDQMTSLYTCPPKSYPTEAERLHLNCMEISPNEVFALRTYTMSGRQHGTAGMIARVRMRTERSRSHKPYLDDFVVKLDRNFPLQDKIELIAGVSCEKYSVRAKR